MELKGKKVVVVGLGRTALALVRLLLDQRAKPFVSEHKMPDALHVFCDELDTLGVPYECGGHSAEFWANADYIVPSPGVPPTIEPIREAQAAGATVLGEMELASRFCKAKILAVTGTNGKTTTTELLYALLKSCGESVTLCGNNDSPFSEVVLKSTQPDYIVLEVSSYQLETASTFRPWIGAVLNLTPDHLARHGDMAGYAEVKSRLFAHQHAGDVAVLNADDAYTNAMPVSSDADVWRFSITAPQTRGLWLDGDRIMSHDGELATTSDVLLPGRHNLENVLAAVAMARAGGFNWDGVVSGLRAFRGVEHRIEPLGVIGGVQFYNDSKSTNIDSLRVALESFEDPIVLIAGGQGKGADYRVLRDTVAKHVKHLVGLGEDGPKLIEAFSDVVSSEMTHTMVDAVRQAMVAAAPGEIVLLSPACASFDMYNNFEERGRDFKAVVASLADRVSAS